MVALDSPRDWLPKMAAQTGLTIDTELAQRARP